LLGLLIGINKYSILFYLIIISWFS